MFSRNTKKKKPFVPLSLLSGTLFQILIQKTKSILVGVGGGGGGGGETPKRVIGKQYRPWSDVASDQGLHC